jgi:D-glycero-D-manno-heptose 1,7-bisphosphate phosphatase
MNLDKTMVKLAIIDMDGTVRESISGSKFINLPRDQKLIDGAIAAINYLQHKGYIVVGATNQGGVIKGHKSMFDCIEEQQYTLQLLADVDVRIESILFCPDNGDECYQAVSQNLTVNALHTYTDAFIGKYRKPQAGMLLHAIALYGADEAVMIGDRPEDKEAALNAGIEFIDAVEWRSPYWIA